MDSLNLVSRHYSLVCTSLSLSLPLSLSVPLFPSFTDHCHLASIFHSSMSLLEVTAFCGSVLNNRTPVFAPATARDREGDRGLVFHMKRSVHFPPLVISVIGQKKEEKKVHRAAVMVTAPACVAEVTEALIKGERTYLVMCKNHGNKADTQIMHSDCFIFRKMRKINIFILLCLNMKPSIDYTYSKGEV